MPERHPSVQNDGVDLTTDQSVVTGTSWRLVPKSSHELCHIEGIALEQTDRVI